MNPTLTEDDEGKRVVGSEGETLGIVDKIDAGVAHVEPDAGDYDAVERYLEAENPENDVYTFQETDVEDVTDDEIVLKGGE